MKKNIIVIIMLLFAYVSVEALTIKSDIFNYELVVNDSCVVSYLSKDSSRVCITSPDKMSVVYIVTAQTGDYDKTYNNDFLKEYDRDIFKILDKEPDDINTYFFTSKEDHFYILPDSTVCKTRTILWNDKAGMIAGFSRYGNMDFINKCMDDFKSSTTLGKIATLIYIFIVFCLMIIGIVLWEDNKFVTFIYILIVGAAWYYFHWILDISTNHFILSLFG
jgi:hypothetical protein